MKVINNLNLPEYCSKHDINLENIFLIHIHGDRNNPDVSLQSWIEPAESRLAYMDFIIDINQLLLTGGSLIEEIYETPSYNSGNMFFKEFKKSKTQNDTVSMVEEFIDFNIRSDKQDRYNTIVCSSDDFTNIYHLLRRDVYILALTDKDSSRGNTNK